jgi:hypothetical protein
MMLEGVVKFPLPLPLNEPVIVPAEKFPLASLLTRVEGAFVVLAALVRVLEACHALKFVDEIQPFAEAEAAVQVSVVRPELVDALMAPDPLITWAAVVSELIEVMALPPPPPVGGYLS